MTDTPQGNAEIADYRIAVERHLADLPAEIREDLLSDLETHLAEVAAEAEPGTSLSELLGSPETYARELRETVAVPKTGLGERLRQGLGKRARHLADRFTESAGAGEASDFRKALRPGWWVLRGFLAAMLVTYFFLEIVFGGLVVYRLFSYMGVVVIFLAGLHLAFIWFSVRLGVRSQRWGRNPQRILAVAGVLLFVVTAASFASGIQRLAYFGGGFTTTTSTDADHHYHVQDVYAYTEDGELLSGVYLFDQNGEPLYLGDPGFCEQEMNTNPFEEGAPEGIEPGSRDHGRFGYLYPLCGTESAQEPGESDPTSLPVEETTPAEELTGEPTGEEPTETATSSEPTSEPTQE